MASILIHTADESVTLTAQTVKRLLDRGDGDAALLYLALLRHHGTVQPRSLAGELRWEKSRIEAAEQALRDLRLLVKELPPSPKISPNAIIRVKIGDPRATPATRSVLPVPAIKYVSTIL